MSTWPGTASRICARTRFHTTATRIRKQTESGSLGPWEDLAEVRDHQEHTSPATRWQTAHSRRIATNKSSFHDSPFGPPTIVHSDYAHYHHSRSTPQRFRPSVMF